MEEEKQNGGRGIIILILAAIPVVALLVVIVPPLFFMIMLHLSIDDPFDDRTFDRQLWVQYDGSLDSDNPRGQMFVDLTTKVLKTGMTRAEVVELLGEPDYFRVQSCGCEPDDQKLEYMLGMWSGLGIDYDSLRVELDDEDRVLKLSRHQH